MKYKYDVFISYSRKDYVEGNKIKPSNVISKLQKPLDRMVYHIGLTKTAFTAVTNSVELS